MKKLTDFAVQSAMDLLIHTNGKTSTLEIKNFLRDLGYLANQNKVHEIVDGLFSSDHEYKFDRVVEQKNNIKYNVYSFSESFLDDNDEFVSDATGTFTTASSSIGTTAASDSSNVVSSVSTNTTTAAPFTTKLKDIASPSLGTPPAKPVSRVAPSTTLSRDPLFIFYTENHAKKSGSDEEAWVVYHTSGNNEIQIFDKDLTRDLVRSRYATILNVKIQDVRSRRFRNY
jgi:hypothetical protein